jgi:hypothetical protein
VPRFSLPNIAAFAHQCNDTVLDPGKFIRSFRFFDLGVAQGHPLFGKEDAWDEALTWSRDASQSHIRKLVARIYWLQN